MTEEGGTPGGTISRRGFIAAGSAVGVGAIVLGTAACSSGSGSSSSSSAAASGSATSAAPTPSDSIVRGGTLQFAVTDANSSETLDPAISAVTDDAAICATLYEGLVRYNSNWELIPMLADSWEVSPDAKTWTFTLREGATFHDGTPVTPQDVIYSIGRNLDPELGSAITARLSDSLDASGMSAPDAKTVKFALKRPDSLFGLVVGARQGFIVKDGTTDFSKGIGTGPFTLVSFTPGTGWEVAANPNYWNTGLPYLAGIRSVSIPEQATKVQSVVSGDSDVGDRMDATQVATVTSSSDAMVQTVANQNFLDIAMDATQKPFDNPKVIMAMKLAAGREIMLATAQQSLGNVTSDCPAPSDDPYFPADTVGIRTPDPEAAKAMLAEAGYPDGIDVELFTSDVFGGLVDMAVTFAETVKPAGIRVTVNNYSPDTYWDDVWLKKPMYCSYYNRRHPNEALALNYFPKADWNEGRYNNPEIVTLCNEGMATTDQAKQVEIYKKALALVANEAGMLIPYFIDTQWPTKKTVNGLIFDPSSSILFTEAWKSA